MHRIDTKNTTEIDGKKLFTNGDPTGVELQEATELDADWFNAVQEELCTAIESAGVELDKGQRGQLLQAIDKKLAPILKRLDAIEKTLEGN